MKAASKERLRDGISASGGNGTGVQHNMSDATATGRGRERRRTRARTRKQVLTEFRTTEILRAARAVFAERGFDGATTADIARAAGIAKGTVYLYYRSKQDVYWAAMRHGLEELYAETRRRVEAVQTIERKIRAFIETRVQYFHEHRDFFRIFTLELGHASGGHPRFPRGFEEMYLEQVREIEAVLHQAARRKDVRPVPADAAAFAILELTRSAVTQRVRGWSRRTVAEDVDLVFDLVWKGIATR